MRTLLIAILAVLVTSSLSAQKVAVDNTDPADVQRVLIPLAFAGAVPGAYGSAWSMEFTGRNASDLPLRFKNRDPYVACPFECALMVVPAHSSFSLSFSPIPPTGWPLGALYYYPRTDAQYVTFSLRIRDVSRALSTWGTEIPLVRETAALTQGTSLFPIPTDSHFRATLRVYDFFPPQTGDAAVRVRLFSVATDALVGETVLTVYSTAFVSSDPFPQRPGFGQITNLLEQFPGATDIGAVRLEIQPLTPNLRYWAFVSVTNNETQHITTITPQ